MVPALHDRLSSMTPQQTTGMFAAIVGSGIATTGLYRVTGLSCPMSSLGLACPGCGCGRAATKFLQEGLVSALAAQPTATVLLLSLVATGLFGGVAAVWPRLRSGWGFYGVGLAGVINWVWQLSN